MVKRRIVCSVGAIQGRSGVTVQRFVTRHMPARKESFLGCCATSTTPRLSASWTLVSDARRASPGSTDLCDSFLGQVWDSTGCGKEPAGSCADVWGLFPDNCTACLPAVRSALRAQCATLTSAVCCRRNLTCHTRVFDQVLDHTRMVWCSYRLDTYDAHLCQRYQGPDVPLFSKTTN